MPDDVYKKYSIRSEYSLFVEFKDSKKACKSCQSRGWNCSFNDASCQYCKSHGYNCNPPNDGKTFNVPVYLSIDGKTWYLFLLFLMR
jgi:hypothetical protein